MAYQLKYYYEYRTITDELHRVEIHHDTTATLTATEITGANDPFIAEMPELSHKFQVVRGKGCTLRLLSETDGQFFNTLYHEGAKEMMVKHYIDGVLKDNFYLDSEMMSEPYQEAFNYVVTVTGNDGFALMSRFSFLQADESKYTGLKSKIELLQICLNKIGLWDEICFDLATTHANITTSLLHDSDVDCSNFYDEDNKPMSLREVIESILAPYGAHIYSEYGRVYISDIHTKASKSTVNYLRFSLTDLSALSTLNNANIKQVTADDYMGTGSIKDIYGGVNRQVVAYSPYPVVNILDNALNMKNFTSEGEWEYYNYYYRKTVGDNDTWISDHFEASKKNINEPVNYYIKVPQVITYAEIARLRNPRQINFPAVSYDYATYQKHGVMLHITGELLLRTKPNPYNDINDGTPHEFTQLVFEIKCGDKYYVGSTSSETFPQAQWQTEQGYFDAITSSKDFGSLNNKWVELGSRGSGIPILFNESVSGELQIKIVAYSLFGEIWIRSMEVSVTDIDGNQIPDNDVEYLGEMNKEFQNEGEKITLTCGTDTYYADRAKIMNLSGGEYSSILEWTRNSQTFKIEELLLNSLCSNYKAGFITISSLKLKSDFSIQNILNFAIHVLFTVEATYERATGWGYEGTIEDYTVLYNAWGPITNINEDWQFQQSIGYTGTYLQWASIFNEVDIRKFMVKYARINYWNNVTECTLVEILPDSLIIVK